MIERERERERDDTHVILFYVFHIQNPPAIPTLMIARIVATLRQAKLIIDWHNFGYSVLGIKLGMDSKVVQLAKRNEQYFGKRPYAHLTVTDRMHRELVDWGVRQTIYIYIYI